MKKILILTVMLFGWVTFSSAQKIAIVDMSYLLKNIPMYESANEQLKQISQKWQKEVDALNEEAELLYKNYQTESVFLSDEMKRKKENEIVAKEKQASDLKRTYFGPDGEYYKKRESLMKPIQDEVYVAVKDIADTKGYQVVLDKSSSQNLIYFSVKVDISDEVLEKLGYSK
ncbi:MAG: OmpH family outer membrane protein [Paludibacteraceae bacterium]|nr:OmpH family outer membrane protein [Bacteroidales bacterium]MBO5132562.1 OmpH family outer membrane protein [Paludibacteraceae bacterium]MBQ9100239.1 OmpH family outer membrane protein [Paludibacteraceae bacterium]MBR6658577.1 OmpH family outer membrane protein [Paludibacteraceae bacterium]